MPKRESLQDMGYRRIALGGMVPLKTDQILACLRRISDVLRARDRNCTCWASLALQRWINSLRWG